MKATIPIGVPPGMRVMHIERYVGEFGLYRDDGSICETPDGHWKFWIHRSASDRLLGTYLALYDNGKIERITVRANEGDEIVLIKPED